MVKYLLILSCLIVGASSCVSSKKFSDLEVVKEHYKFKGDTLNMLKKQNVTLSRTLTNTKADLTATNIDLSATKSNLGQLRSRHDQLSADYKQLENNIEKLSSSSQSETKSLRGQLNQATKENERMKSILTNLDWTYQTRMNGAVLADDSWNKKLQRMQDVSETLNSEKAQLESLFQLLSGLPVFQKEGMEVIMGSGNLIIRMGADYIFRSGHNQINSVGRKALTEITGIILRNSNLDVHIEGHTDTKGSDVNNWRTSASRATSVAVEMVRNQFMPTRIYAIGRSSHDPINSDDSSAARKLNRRVEILLKPRTTLH